jgi:hypothetical protein
MRGYTVSRSEVGEHQLRAQATAPRFSPRRAAVGKGVFRAHPLVVVGPLTLQIVDAG